MMQGGALAMMQGGALAMMQGGALAMTKRVRMSDGCWALSMLVMTEAHSRVRKG